MQADRDRQEAFLPEPVREKMEKLLGQEEYGAYLESFSAPALNGLRVNCLKLSPEEFEALSPFDLSRVPWIRNGYFREGEWGEEERPSKHPFYFAGLYYLQEPSAMTPASLLPVEPGDRVLDLCAAPGGKSTELGARLKGQGLLFSNDVSNSRARALLKNLELSGVANLCVSSETPEKLASLLPEFFDKILVDAPCSGEGMFRRDPDMVKSYREKGPETYLPVQRSILTQAVKLLRPGGLLLYSTCTFDQEEDEGNVLWLLEQFPELQLLPLPRQKGFSDGIGLEGCLRLFPHKIQGEGHFMALLCKEGQETGTGAEGLSFGKAREGGECQSPEGFYGLEAETVSFLTSLGLFLPPGQVRERKGCVYLFPKPLSELDPGVMRQLRFLRTGLLLGEEKKGRFEPSQALAMALKREEFPVSFSLPPEDGRVLRYLKGETVSLTEEEAALLPEKGWCLFCVREFPLGWCKIAGGNLKNKYYPGWRWQ